MPGVFSHRPSGLLDESFSPGSARHCRNIFSPCSAAGYPRLPTNRAAGYRWASTLPAKAQTRLHRRVPLSHRRTDRAFQGDYATESMKHATSRFRVSTLLPTNQLANNSLTEAMRLDDSDASPSRPAA